MCKRKITFVLDYREADSTALGFLGELPTTLCEVKNHSSKAELMDQIKRGLKFLTSGRGDVLRYAIELNENLICQMDVTVFVWVNTFGYTSASWDRIKLDESYAVRMRLAMESSVFVLEDAEYKRKITYMMGYNSATNTASTCLGDFPTTYHMGIHVNSNQELHDQIREDLRFFLCDAKGAAYCVAEDSVCAFAGQCWDYVIVFVDLGDIAFMPASGERKECAYGTLSLRKRLDDATWSVL